MGVSKQRRRELYARKKIEHPEKIKKIAEQTKEWMRMHPEKRAEYKKRWVNKKGIKQVRKESLACRKERHKNLWYRTYHAIYNRLQKSKNIEKWGNRFRCYIGIEMHLTPSDLKYLYERDKAHLLNKPSIDRIDTNGHYTLDNCQYIEMSANRAKVDKTGPRKK